MYFQPLHCLVYGLSTDRRVLQIPEAPPARATAIALTHLEMAIGIAPTVLIAMTVAIVLAVGVVTGVGTVLIVLTAWTAAIVRTGMA